MNKPKTFEEFENIVRSMDHRERFCFDMEGKKILEIYCTLKFGSGKYNWSFKYQFNNKVKPTSKTESSLTSEILLNVYNKLV